MRKTPTFLRLLLAGSAAALMAVYAGSARAQTVHSFSFVDVYNYEAFQLQGTNISPIDAATGIYRIDVDGKQYNSFCVDPFEDEISPTSAYLNSINNDYSNPSNPDSTYFTSTDTSGNRVADLKLRAEAISYLINTYVDNYSTYGQSGEADAQLAVWALAADPSTDNVSNKSSWANDAAFTVTNIGSALTTVQNDIATALTNASLNNDSTWVDTFTSHGSGASQDYGISKQDIPPPTPTPEPAFFQLGGLLAMGGLASGFRRLRSRSKALK